MEGWQGEADIGEDRTLRGIETMRFEVILCDAHKWPWWSGDLGIAKELSVELARKKLDADFIPLNNCNRN